VVKKLCIFFGIFFIILSCKKEIILPNDGIYRGVFNEIRASGDTVASGVVWFALFDDNQTFTMVGDSNTHAPHSHNGTYLIQDAKFIQYTLTGAASGGYDDDHILDTTYQYMFDDKLFEFFFQDDTVLYEYRLTRK
jgi:hypothetical protein